MARMKKGRDEREKVKAMQTRGYNGSITDESLLQPMQISGNNAYKGTFSTFQHMPEYTK